MKVLYRGGTREQHAKGDGEMDDTHMHKKNYTSYDLERDSSMA